MERIEELLLDLSFIKSLKKHDLRDENVEFPDGVWYIAVSNTSWEYRRFYDAQKSHHGRYSFGGYSHKDSDDCPWWTFNAYDFLASPYFWTTDNADDADKMSKLLNYLTDCNNIKLENIEDGISDRIYQMKKEIATLQLLKDNIPNIL